MKLNNNQKALLTLVRAGLWEKNDRLSHIGNIDFNEVVRLAELQTVLGLMAAGTEHLTDVKLPQVVSLQLAGEVLKIEQRSKAMNEYVEQLITRLRERGVYALLMKGQGIAQCYERPLWRTCGDIDLLLSNDNFKAAKSILIPIASSVDDEDEKRKHLALTIDKWVIELHGTLRTSLWKRLERVMDEVLEDVFYKGNVRSWMNGNTQVFLLKADEDVVFVFAHILQHFFVEGIGLRQICDWCRLLYTFNDKIDKKLLERRLKSAKLMEKWKVFAAFAVEYLGMPGSEMPFYSNSWRYKRKAKMVMTLVMDAGNFGQGKDKSYKETHSKIICYCISFGKHAKDGFRRFILFPREAIFMWGKLMLFGLKNVLHLSKPSHFL